MAELTSALDGLASDDLHVIGAGALLERAAELVQAANRIAAELARTVRVADLTQAPEHDGQKTMRSWLRGHARLSPAAVDKVIRNGRAMEHLPTMAAAFAAGAVTAEQLSTVAPVAAEDSRAKALDQGIDLTEIDAVLTRVATTRPHADLDKVVNHYLSCLDPDGTEPDPTEQRSLTIAKHADGSLTFRGELDAVGGEKFQTALESILQANRPEGDLRSRAQQQGDALVQLCDIQLASGNLPILRTVKPQVIVKIGIDDLVDPATGPGAADMGFGATISAARARWIACDGNVTRIVIGPEGRPMDVGRSKRSYPPHLRRVIEVRDEHCVFAGCYAPTYWCDVHHLLHWADDGETSEENGALLCERHHTKVHHGFSIVRDADGRWHTYRPDGSEILIAAPLRI